MRSIYQKFAVRSLNKKWIEPKQGEFWKTLISQSNFLLAEKHFGINVKWRVRRIKGGEAFAAACFDKLCDTQERSRRARFSAEQFE